jgi:hypothetical protein
MGDFGIDGLFGRDNRRLQKEQMFEFNLKFQADRNMGAFVVPV